MTRRGDSSTLSRGTTMSMCIDPMARKCSNTFRLSPTFIKPRQTRLLAPPRSRRKTSPSFLCRLYRPPNPGPASISSPRLAMVCAYSLVPAPTVIPTGPLVDQIAHLHWSMCAYHQLRSFIPMSRRTCTDHQQACTTLVQSLPNTPRDLSFPAILSTSPTSMASRSRRKPGIQTTTSFAWLLISPVSETSARSTHHNARRNNPMSLHMEPRHRRHLDLRCSNMRLC